MSQHTPKVPMHEDEINMHKPVCAEFASFRAGIRCAERVYQVTDLVRQVNYWTDEWSDVSDQNQSLRNQLERLKAEAEAAVKQARIDALEEAKQHLVKLKEQSLAAQTKDAAPMTFADDVNKNIRLATVLLAGAIDGIESLKGTP